MDTDLGAIVEMNLCEISQRLLAWVPDSMGGTAKPYGQESEGGYLTPQG